MILRELNLYIGARELRAFLQLLLAFTVQHLLLKSINFLDERVSLAYKAFYLVHQLLEFVPLRIALLSQFQKLGMQILHLILSLPHLIPMEMCCGRELSDLHIDLLIQRLKALLLDIALLLQRLQVYCGIVHLLCEFYLLQVHLFDLLKDSVVV